MAKSDVKENLNSQAWDDIGNHFNVLQVDSLDLVVVSSTLSKGPNSSRTGVESETRELPGQWVWMWECLCLYGFWLFCLWGPRIVLDRPPKTEPNQTVKETEADTERCYVTVPTWKWDLLNLWHYGIVCECVYFLVTYPLHVPTGHASLFQTCFTF